MRDDLRGWWQRWLTRRLPASRDITLDRRRIFIFLTGTGATLLLISLAIFVAGIDYGNNLLLGLSFVLASVLLLSIYHTYVNFSGVRIQAFAGDPGYAGAHASFHLQLSVQDARRQRACLRCDWAGSEVEVAVVGEGERVDFYLPVARRGRYRPPRLHLSCVYPLGLLRCWTWLDLDLCTLVYPAPRAAIALPVGGAGERRGDRQVLPGQEDFAGLRAYHAGDSRAQIAWRQAARAQTLLSKVHASEAAPAPMLDWYFYQGVEREQRLSHLCWWVLTLSRQERAYGLRLPGVEIAIAAGARQQQLCLEALALFELAR